MRKQGNCLYCGKHVVQIFRGRDKYPGKIFCCSAHAMSQRSAQLYQTAQKDIQIAVSKLYEELKRAPTMKELQLATGKSRNTLFKHKYNTKRLKEQFGQKYIPKRTNEKYSFQQATKICKQYLLQHKQEYVSNLKLHEVLRVRRQYLDKMHLVQFRKENGIPNQPTPNPSQLEANVVALIKKNGQYTPLRHVLDTLHIDYYCSFLKIGKRIQVLNREAGFERPYNSYGQIYLFKQLKKSFPYIKVDRERKFQDLLSPKGFPLRYDFYLPEYKIAIQVDGTQHSDQTAQYYSEYLCKKDAIKTNYAEQHGIELIRIPFKGALQFHSAVQKVIQYLLDVVKPVELLEHQQDQKGVLLVNQQLSRERRQETESSETIEKRVECKQFDF